MGAFPVFIWFKFGNYKEIIFEDQVLFAQDRGRSPDTNPHFAFRKRYSKLYKNYKPEKWYWVIVILVKKLGLCFTALMFKRNPMFQLSVAVMILFWATTMQLNHRPFMSMIERSQIVDEASKRDFQRGEKLVRKMNAFGGDAADIEKLQNQLKMEETAQKQISYALKLSAKYFVNYNDVESVFLVASIRHVQCRCMCSGIFIYLLLLCHWYGNYRTKKNTISQLIRLSGNLSRKRLHFTKTCLEQQTITHRLRKKKRRQESRRHLKEENQDKSCMIKSWKMVQKNKKKLCETWRRRGNKEKKPVSKRRRNAQKELGRKRKETVSAVPKAKGGRRNARSLRRPRIMI